MRSLCQVNTGCRLTLIATVAVASLGLTGCTPRPTQESETASPSPSAFIPTSWELRALPLPHPHENGVMMSVSADSNLVVFRDADIYDPAYLLVGGATVREVAPPGHVQGAPVGAQVRIDNRSLLVSELGQAWTYDVASASYTPIPNPPGTAGGRFVPLPSGQMAVMTGPVASYEFGGVTDTRLWLLDLATMAYSPLGERHDGITLYPARDGVFLIADRSPHHDNSRWVFYRVGLDGVDTVVYSLDAGPGSFDIALDGAHLAITKAVEGQDGTWLVDVASGAERWISSGFAGVFSPDGRQLSIWFADGHTEAVDLDGTVKASIASHSVGWIGVP